jgi:hypothetical protein
MYLFELKKKVYDHGTLNMPDFIWIKEEGVNNRKIRQRNIEERVEDLQLFAWRNEI